jgi:phospholipid transport system substrate-binding protein
MNEEKKRLSKIAFTVCSLLLLISNASGSNDSPLEALRGPLEKVIGPLNHPVSTLQIDSGEDAWTTFHQLFDFREISMRSLSSYWIDFSLDQREEFTRLFSQLLTSACLKRIQEECLNNVVAYLSHEMISDRRAVVKTKIIRKNLTDISISYSMRKRAKEWKIYDIDIEGIRLIHNYRLQFRRILMREKPAFLITLLQGKIRQQIEENASGERILAESRSTDAKVEWQQFAQKCFLAIWLEGADRK